ncbi:hypothetical protein RJ639_031297 [Escallonia herrerae]|uniref:Uncharacterized protein n=1 Tax=Escallonia herrerae TaxID=1293975 RepID=A0AA88X0A8_9ASTE|nr:hypothetical protein RJ639_031297 [Escallonia herrerae]
MAHGVDDALADGLQDINDTAKPSYSSPKGSSNKENINSNQIEVPRLSMEPLQMKRRKKGGGCNLRKSLAWDRAFFTDEDPFELSMITGTFGKSSGEPLSVINEEGRNVFSGDSKPTIKYLDVQAFREILSTEVSDIALSENRDKGGSLVSGHNSSAYDGSTPTSVDILTMESGAVTNSPPDKSQPEPGPWSPLIYKTLSAKSMNLNDPLSFLLFEWRMEEKFGKND